MTDSETRITAQWHESYDHSPWVGIPDPEDRRRYEEFMAPFRGVFDSILADSENHIYEKIEEELAPQLGMEGTTDEDKTLIANELPELGPRASAKLVWRGTVESSELLLVSTVIRAAKAAENRQTSLTGVEWGELTFERRGINPNGEEDENWFEKVCGEADPNNQKKILGYCALKMIESGAFRVPLRVAFRGEVATIQTA